MKECVVCKQIKSLDQFHKKTAAKDGLQGKCKDCNKRVVKAWQSNNAEQHETYWRAREADDVRRKEAKFKKRARQYGLSVNELQDMLDAAQGKCDICQEKPNRWLVVDHCHDSLKVRGILCEACNQGLGLFKDNKVALQRAIEYLNK